MQSKYQVAFTLKIREELFSNMFIAIKFSLISFLLESFILNHKRFSYKCKFSNLIFWILSFPLEKINLGIRVWNKNHNNKYNNVSLILLLKNKRYKTSIIDTSTVLEAQITRRNGHWVFRWLGLVFDNLHKDRPFTVFQLAVHTCGYGLQCARRQSSYIGLDSVIHKYLHIVFNRIWGACILSRHPLCNNSHRFSLIIIYITRK